MSTAGKLDKNHQLDASHLLHEFPVRLGGLGQGPFQVSPDRGGGVRAVSKSQEHTNRR
jgi:hypothetical protein